MGNILATAALYPASGSGAVHGPSLSRASYRASFTSARALLVDFTAQAGKAGPGTLVLVLAGAVLEGLSFSLLVPLLGVLWGGGATAGKLGGIAASLFALAGTQSQLSRSLLLLTLFGLLMIARSVVVAGRDMAVNSLQIKFAGALRLRLAMRLAATRWEHIARLRHARVTQLMVDIQRLAIGVQFALKALAAASMLLAQCLLAFVLAPMLATWLFGLLIAGLLALGGMMARSRLVGGQIMDANLSLLSGTAQFLGGLKLAISQNLESGFVEETGQTLRLLAAHQSAQLRQQALRQIAFAGLAAVLGAALVMAGLGWLHLAPAVLMTLTLVVTRMAGPAGQIQQGVQQFAHILPIHEELRSLDEELMAFADAAETGVQTYPEGDIIFADVGYRPAGEEAGRGLRHFNLRLEPGDFLGVTGPSGSGKTLFADLLAGLYPPQTGTLRVGGRALEGGALTAWRRALSYVAQDAFLFHDSIRRNLSWGNCAATQEEMWHALAVAGVDDLVRGLENGLDSVVGERGTLISGGERQRIALARALLRKPRLLILDEATGAIDSEGEREILERLRALPARPTIVVIAHRRENLATCERIVDFEIQRSR